MGILLQDFAHTDRHARPVLLAALDQFIVPPLEIPHTIDQFTVRVHMQPFCHGKVVGPGNDAVAAHLTFFHLLDNIMVDLGNAHFPIGKF